MFTCPFYVSEPYDIHICGYSMRLLGLQSIVQHLPVSYCWLTLLLMLGAECVTGGSARWLWRRVRAVHSRCRASSSALLSLPAHRSRRRRQRRRAPAAQSAQPSLSRLLYATSATVLHSAAVPAYTGSPDPRRHHPSPCTPRRLLTTDDGQP